MALKNLIQCKDLVIQKGDKRNTMVITDRTKYSEGIKSLLLDCHKFMQLPIDEGKLINYIINLESKLKNCFKVIKNEEKFSEKKFDGIAPLELRPEFYPVILKYIKQSLTKLLNFHLFYQQKTDLHIC